MIRVLVEMIPHSNPDKRRVLGEAFIDNDGTGTNAECSYNMRLMKSPEYATRPGVWKKGRIERFPRLRLGPWDLLLRGLRAIVGYRNPASARAATLDLDGIDIRRFRIPHPADEWGPRVAAAAKADSPGGTEIDTGWTIYIRKTKGATLPVDLLHVDSIEEAIRVATEAAAALITMDGGTSP